MKSALIALALAFTVAGCTTMGGGNAAPMGYLPNPETGMCSANAEKKIGGVCYDLENTIKYCTLTGAGVYAQECAEYAGGKDR